MLTAGSGFEVQSEAGEIFHDCDLSDDWAEYCEKGDCSVEIMDMEHRFEKA